MALSEKLRENPNLIMLRTNKQWNRYSKVYKKINTETLCKRNKGTKSKDSD